MSDVQKTRIEKNKLLAFKKRAARMGVPVSSLSKTLVLSQMK